MMKIKNNMVEKPDFGPMYLGHRAGEILYLHTDGSVHKVQILQDTSNSEFVCYRVKVLEALKPTFLDYMHPVGKVFEVSVNREHGYAYWEFTQTEFLDS